MTARPHAAGDEWILRTLALAQALARTRWGVAFMVQRGLLRFTGSGRPRDLMANNDNARGAA